MLLYTYNTILRESGPINAIDLSQGKIVSTDCFSLTINDGTSILVPQGTFIQLEDRVKKIEKNEESCFYGTRSKYKLKYPTIDFVSEIVDPYIMGLAFCTPVRNNTLQTKKITKVDLKKIPKEYYSLRLREMSCDYFELAPDEDSPNLLRLDVKKHKQFASLKLRQIPDEFLFTRKEDRELLLRGCMDIFGKCYRGETTFECSSEQLAKDISFLVKSLHGFAKIRVKEGKAPYYIVSISFDSSFNPFLLKANTFKPSKKPRVRCIEHITYVGKRPCVNIPVNSVKLDSWVELIDQ
jgi:hypothetical protein